MSDEIISIDELERLADAGGPENLWDASTDEWIVGDFELNQSVLLSALLSDGIDGLRNELARIIKPVARRAFLCGVIAALREQSMFAGPKGFSTTYAVNGKRVSVTCPVAVDIFNNGEPDLLISPDEDIDVASSLRPIATSQ